SVCKRLDGKLGAPTDGCGVFTKSERELDLGRTATGDELPVLESDTDDPECVLEGTVKFINDVLGSATDDDRDSLRVLATGDKDHLLSGDLLLFDGAGLPEFFGGDSVDGADDGRA